MELLCIFSMTDGIKYCPMRKQSINKFVFDPESKKEVASIVEYFLPCIKTECAWFNKYYNNCAIFVGD